MGRGPEWVRAISSCPDSDRALSWRLMSSSAPASKGLPSRPGPPCSTATNMQRGAFRRCVRGLTCPGCERRWVPRRLGPGPGNRIDRALVRAAVGVPDRGSAP